MEDRFCECCGKKLTKDKYESKARFKKKRFCSIECSHKGLKRNGEGFFGKDAFGKASKRSISQKQREEQEFITALENILNNPGDLTAEQLEKTRKVLNDRKRNRSKASA